jgi:hypothetical protein
MIPNTKDRALTSSAISASANFGISLKDSSFIMSILRDQIYSDKIMAVLREYSANAWDANRMVGKADRPIKVTIPTSMEPTLSIRDYGPGLSVDEVLTVYTQYGASTKRDSDVAVGMLGIGSKSGFAYSDTFTVTSWYGGKKCIYVAALDTTNTGVINLIHEEDSDEESGIEVSIAVRSSDVLEFHNKARVLFKYFEPRPEINIELPPPPTEAAKLKNGFITDEALGGGGLHQWVAVMGCVPYRINLDQVRAFNNQGVGIAEYFVKVSGALNFNIGDVQISASREELKYSDGTKKALMSKFSAVVDEFVEHTFDSLEKGTLNFWERRLKAQTLAAMSLPIPKKYSYITKDVIEIHHEPKTFKFTVHGSEVGSIAVDARSKIVLRDDDKELVGYHLEWRDYLVEKKKDATWDEVRAEIDAMLIEAKLEGMPVETISSRSWWTNQKQKLKAMKTANKKHSVSTFEFLPTAGRYHPWSSCWDISLREPDKDDVYVLLKKFRTDTDKHSPDSFNFYELYKEDEFVAKQLGSTLPKIYGYKTTDKAPFDVSTVKGTEYRTWRSDWIKSLMTKQYIKIFNYWEWVQSPHDIYYRHEGLPSNARVTELVASLGADHPISTFFRKIISAKRVIKSGKLKREHLSMLHIVKTRVYADLKSEYDTARDQIRDAYPLLKRYGVDTLWTEETEHWLEYIKLIDSSKLVSP